MQAWTPIRDYEANPSDLADADLSTLAADWRDRKLSMDEDAVELFVEKSRREWAIETGLIERLYELDRGVTELLIEKGIEASLVPYSAGLTSSQTAMIADQKQTIDALFDFVGGTRELSTSYIRELHQSLTRSQEHVEAVDSRNRPVRVPFLRGEYKRQPNNPLRPGGGVHYYCPPEQVASEMDRLIDLHHEHNHYETAPEVEAAWLHHRFSQIHPFQDGNGRVARALAVLIFVKAGLLPLVVRDRDRADYIRCLEHADGGDLAPLVRFFAEIQKLALRRAASLSRRVVSEARLDDRLAALDRSLKERHWRLEKDWSHAVDLAGDLHKVACDRFDEVRAQLRELPVRNEFSFLVDSESGTGGRRWWYRKEIIAVAQELDYYADLYGHKAWACLTVQNEGTREQVAKVLLSFHGVGYEFRGFLQCSAIWFQRLRTGGERDGLDSTRAEALCTGTFPIRYTQAADRVIRRRFLEWLDEALERGLARWQAQL